MASCSGVALVTSVWLGSNAKGSRHLDVLNAFLLYHLEIGIAKIFVFFDGDETTQPSPENLDEKVHEHITAGRIALYYKCIDQNHGRFNYFVQSLDGTLHPTSSCQQYKSLCDQVEYDVASRQQLHAELAMKFCIEINSTSLNPHLRWLLHLDVDELFYCEGFATTNLSPSEQLVSVINSIDQAAIDQLIIVNYEAIPTHVYGANYFVNTTRFRRHTSQLSMSSDTRTCLQYWQRRSPHGQYFLFYDNGKAIVRVPSEPSTIVPASVHHWCNVSSTTTWHTASNFFDPRRNITTVWRPSKKTHHICILHYPVCGLEWLEEKYTRLGSFKNIWGASLIPILPCFHLQARDASQINDESERKKALALLYRSQVKFPSDIDGECGWEAQLRSGVCQEISFPSQLISKLLGPHRMDNATIHMNIPASIGNVQTANAMVRQHDGEGLLTIEKAWVLATIANKYL